MILRPLRLLSVVLAAAAASLASPAQAQELTVPAASPAAKVSATVGVATVSVEYSSPAVKGRKVFGDVVQLGQVWRAGANASTKITFSGDATIAGRAVPAGTYAIYAIPTAAEWTFILSKDTSLWGADGYKEANDLLRVQAAPTAIPHRERLAFEILDASEQGGVLALEWGTVRVAVPFQVDTRAAVLKQIQALQADGWRATNRAARYLVDGKREPALARDLVEKSLALREHWQNLWTKAELLAQTGDKKGALVAAKRAYELGRKSDGFFAKEAIEKALAEWK